MLDVGLCEDQNVPLDNAHKILDIYAYFKGTPGHVLISNHFLAVGLRRRWEVNDLQDGIVQAYRAGWIAKAEEGGWRLTENGFAEFSATPA